MATGQNVFRELLRYASYTEKHPRENILTGSLAFLLSDNLRLRTGFIRELSRLYRRKNRRFHHPSLRLDTLHLKTQSSFKRHNQEATEPNTSSRDQIDIEIGDSDGQFGIFIENKIGASLGFKQDVRYRQVLDGAYKRGMLVFITQSGNHPVVRNVEHIQLRWADVYRIFQKHRQNESDPVRRYLLIQFLEYMEGENMAAFKGIKRKEFKGTMWSDTYDFAERLRSVLESVRHELEENGWTARSVKPTNWDIYFDCRPPSRKGRSRPQGRTRCHFYVYSKKTWTKDFNRGDEEGVFASVEWWGRTRLKDFRERNRILSKSGYEGFDPSDNYFDLSESLSKIVGHEKDPEKQERELLRFFQKALSHFQKAGII